MLDLVLSIWYITYLIVSFQSIDAKFHSPFHFPSPPKTSIYSRTKLIKQTTQILWSISMLASSVSLVSIKKSIASTDNDVVVPKLERIYDTIKKSYLPSHPEKFLHKEMKNRNVIVMGEVHSDSLDHLLEFRLLSTLAGFYNPKNIAIGLECFYRQHQHALDNFIYNHGSMGILKRETNWPQTWGYNLSSYARIFNYAYKNKIRLVGLNIPIQAVQYVAMNGLDHVPDSLRLLLPTVDMNNSKHRERFMNTILHLDGHGGKDDNNDNSDQNNHSHNGNHGTNPIILEHLYESQSLWDEYMAESAANFIQKNPTMILMVIAGNGHVAGRFGIPDRITKRTGNKPFVVVPYEVNWNQDGLPSIDIPPSSNECDWAWYHGPDPKTA